VGVKERIRLQFSLQRLYEIRHRGSVARHFVPPRRELKYSGNYFESPCGAGGGFFNVSSQALQPRNSIAASRAIFHIWGLLPMPVSVNTY